MKTNQRSIPRGNLLNPNLVTQIIDSVITRARTHPKVTECADADFKLFESLEDAENSMKEKEIEAYEKFLRCEADIARMPSREKYYAVAYGTTIGIFQDWK
ncbi:hypothetical protein N7540_005522 [Penicillium herquei]|nr:hypothetical protein N7540_005522 [Penicillium herquei]